MQKKKITPFHPTIDYVIYGWPLSSDETTETENEQQRLAFEDELASAQWDISPGNLYGLYRLHCWRLEMFTIATSNNIRGGSNNIRADN